MPCNGRCCDQFIVSAGPDVWSSFGAEGVRLRQLLIPVIGLERVFACRAFDIATRRCSEYADRPSMCSAYPYGGICHFCLAISDQEARGVALQTLWPSHNEA